MIRRSLTIVFSLCVVLTFGYGFADACTDVAKCDVERTCTKTENGMTCVVKAKGETTAEDVRKCVRTHVAKTGQAEGVTVKIEDIDGGIQVAMMATSEEGIKALQAHSGGCCAHKAAKGCDHHAKAKTAVAHKCSAECGKDCPHAKTAANAEEKACCGHHAKAKETVAHKHCSADCAKDCPHAKTAAKGKI
jgi:hypothetical protein